MKIKLLTTFLISIFLFNCSNNSNNDSNNEEKTNNSTKTDYSDKNNWLTISQNPNDREVDVFYLYPTVWSRTDSNENIICPIDYEAMRANATNALIQQASVFDEVGSIYAPFYRQADASYLLDKKNNISKDEQDKYFYGIPKEDAISAFDYYIKNYNQHRPFILVGHSQGAMMIKEILKEYFPTNENLMNRLVAAYIIGYSVTQKDLDENPHFRFASSEYDTGVIISYNTESPDFNGYNPTLLEGAISINPITWTLEETIAEKEQNLGSYLFDGNGLNKLENIADAKVDKQRGVIKCSTIDPNDFYVAGSIFEKGVYHVYDINLYYGNLKENARKRVGAFWK